VDGVGRISFPISAAAARKLCAVARPARHGFREETRLDTRVRNTWEIAKARLTLDEAKWQQTLGTQLEKIRTELGLPAGRQLKAKLHNLLVYTPGQFFVAHQDSEKADGMIGTLVVTLPARFTGGEMMIEHHGKKHVSRGSAARLGFTAFYADCRHEVRPIKTGHRVVLTYNLIAHGAASTGAVEEGTITTLQRCMREFFDTSLSPRWSGDSERVVPDRLVYLLDHEYTRRALDWQHLKGADAARGAALQEVARRVDCEIWLAQADVHETWACEDNYPGSYRRGYWDEDDDGDHEAPSEPANLELIDLIDSDVELRHWVGTGGHSAAISKVVGDGELCYTKPHAELEPFKSEYEGYTGNAGNTVDRWYHRAAVVLWPRSRAFVMRAKGSAQWALKEVSKTLQSNESNQASMLVDQLLPFWSQVASREKATAVMDGTLTVVIKLNDAQRAAALLAPLTLWATTPKTVAWLTELFDLYGPQWSRKLLQQWMSDDDIHLPEARLSWMSRTLPKLCSALSAHGSDMRGVVAGWMVAESWRWFRQFIDQGSKEWDAQAFALELPKLGKPLWGLLAAGDVARQLALTGQVIDLLISLDTPLQLALAVLQAAAAAPATARTSASELQRVHARCSKELQQRLHSPPRAKNDWSIATPVPCSCKLCAELTDFLRAKDRSRFDWPLATERRAHIHNVIDRADLPVSHTTRRTGRPFTLVLQKTAALFERDARARQLWQEQLRWLADVGVSLSGTP
jgi:hypothetical protein